MDDATSSRNHRNQAVNSGNQEELVPILKIKQELEDFEDPPYESLNLDFPTENFPFIAVKEELLDFKEEPDILHDLGVSRDDTDHYNSDTEENNLGDESAKDLVPFCEDETVIYNSATVHHNTASPDSGTQPSLSVKPSTLSDYKLPGGHQYSRETVKKRMCRKGKISTIQSQEIQTSFHETITTDKPILQHEIFIISEKTSRCMEKKLNTCETCHKCFSTPSTLKAHIRIHTGIKPYTCDTCHKCFRHLSHFKTHTRIHTEIKPYTCDTCHKCFRRLSHLQTHTRTHTGSKPFTCETCRKCFADLSTLKKHTRIHTGIKPYTCDICHKSFSLSSTLKIHTRIHTGSKPYTCDTCHKCFSDLSSFKKHTRKHTESKPYTCDTCHQFFSQLSHLKTHITVSHKEQILP